MASGPDRPRHQEAPWLPSKDPNLQNAHLPTSQNPNFPLCLSEQAWTVHKVGPALAKTPYCNPRDTFLFLRHIFFGGNVICAYSGKFESVRLDPSGNWTQSGQNTSDTSEEIVCTGCQQYLEDVYVTTCYLFFVVGKI